MTGEPDRAHGACAARPSEAAVARSTRGLAQRGIRGRFIRASRRRDPRPHRLLGAGRTELALALFGMTRLDRGQILIDGRQLVLRSNQVAVAAGIAYVSEDRLWPRHQSPAVDRQQCIDHRPRPTCSRSSAWYPLKPGVGWLPIGGAPWDQGAKGRSGSAVRCRAETSNESCWPNGWRPIPRC